jgi:hypothetical protein
VDDPGDDDFLRVPRHHLSNAACASLIWRKEREALCGGGWKQELHLAKTQAILVTESLGLEGNCYIPGACISEDTLAKCLRVVDRSRALVTDSDFVSKQSLCVMAKRYAPGSKLFQCLITYDCMPE